jgi:hypothetical protein
MCPPTLLSCYLNARQTTLLYRRDIVDNTVLEMGYLPTNYNVELTTYLQIEEKMKTI